MIVDVLGCVSGSTMKIHPNELASAHVQVFRQAVAAHGGDGPAWPFGAHGRCNEWPSKMNEIVRN